MLVVVAVGVEELGGLQEVVAEPTEQPVGVRAPDQPVVPEVAEHDVTPVVALDGLTVRVKHRDTRPAQHVRGEVEQEVDALTATGAHTVDADVLGAVRAVEHLGPRVVRVEVGERPAGRVVAERVERIHAPARQDLGLRHVGVVELQRLGAGDGVVALVAVDPVVADAAPDDVGESARATSRLQRVGEEPSLVEQRTSREDRRDGAEVAQGERRRGVRRRDAPQPGSTSPLRLVRK